MYAYGRASLLHYARWMAEHEQPYLDQPEKLEFPTETWAAQDIRKSDVFYFAMQARGRATSAQRFVEQAGLLPEYAIATLAGMPTRTLARPVIVHAVERLAARVVQQQARRACAAWTAGARVRCAGAIRAAEDEGDAVGRS